MLTLNNTIYLGKAIPSSGGGGGGGATYSAGTGIDITSNVISVKAPTYTQNNLLGGENIDIIPEPVSATFDANDLFCWHFNNSANDAIKNAAFNFATASFSNLGWSEQCISVVSANVSFWEADNLNLKETPITVDFRYKSASGRTSNFSAYLSSNSSWTSGFGMKLLASGTSVGTVGDNMSTQTTYDLSSGVNLNDNQWHHIAFTFNPSTAKVAYFVDGKYINEATVSTPSQNIYYFCFICGTDDPAFVDELRISNKIRYTGDFTPPTGPYPFAQPTGNYVVQLDKDSLLDDSTIIENQNGTISTVAIKEQRADAAIKKWVGTEAQYTDVDTKDSNTEYVTTDDEGAWGQVDNALSLTSINPVQNSVVTGAINSKQGLLSGETGYNATSLQQVLCNENGTLSWKTKELWYYNFNKDSALEVDTQIPSSLSSFEITMSYLIRRKSIGAQDIIRWNGNSIFYEKSSGSNPYTLGFWDDTSQTSTYFSDSIPSTPISKWIKITGTEGNYNVYVLDDNNYNPETLPDISSWTLQGNMNTSFASYTIDISVANGNNNSGYASGLLLKNFIMKANGNKIFDLRSGTDVTITGNTDNIDYTRVMVKEHI